MATTPDDASPEPFFRFQQGWIATLLILAAALILLGLTRTAVIAYAEQRPLFYVPVGLMALAIPGPMLRVWDVPGQILLWNAAGWCLGLVVGGLASIGATTMLPLVLMLFGLTYWPRMAGRPPLWIAGAIAFAGGCAACLIAWEDLTLRFTFEWAAHITIVPVV